MRHIVLSLLVLAAALPARAQDTPRDRFVYEAVGGARVNPLGAQLEVDLGYRHRLTDSQAILMKNTWTGIFLTPSITPSNWKAGVSAVAEPLAILRLEVRYEYLGYFGTWDELQSYASPKADWSPDARTDGGTAGLNYVTGGTWLSLIGRLQAQVGDIAVRNTATFIRTNIKLHDGNPVYYDSTLDLLVPGHGWAFVDDADALWVNGGPLVVGLRYTATGAFYAEGQGTEVTQRIGPLAAYTFPTGPDAIFKQPTIVLVTGWWIAHPYRTGQAVSQAIPYLTLAFAWNGNLL